MKLRLCLWMLCCLCSLGFARAQQLEFLNSTLADALTAIDEHYPETRIHFVYNELESLRISAHLSQGVDAEMAVRAVVGELPVKVTAYRKHIFVEHLHTMAQPVTDLFLPDNESPSLTILLHNVDIEHDIPTIQMHQGQTTLQVAGTTLSQVGSAFDLLTYLPGLAVDDPSAIFFIDGVPISNLSQLTSLDSGQVSRIEYSNNGGHLTRSGKSRVVNIITRLRNEKGVQTRLSSQFSAGHRSSSRQMAALDVHHHRFDLFTQADIEHEGVHKHLTLNQQKRLESYAAYGLDLSAGMNLHFSDNHTIGLQYQYKDILNDIVQTPYELLGSIDPGDLTTNLGNRISDWRMHYAPRHDLNAYYRAHGRQWDLRMGASYYQDEISLSDYQYDILQPRHQQNDIRNRLGAVMAEGEYRMGRSRINVSCEYSYTRREDTYRQFDVDLRSWRYRRQHRASGLVSYGYLSDRWNVEAGLRGEAIHVFELEKYLYPFVSLSVSGNRGSFSASYALHSALPTYAQTDSYMHYNIEQLSVAGNPYLQRARQHQFSIQAQQGDFLLQGNYMHVTDYIAQYIDTRVERFSLNYKNVPQASVLDLSLLYTHTLGRWHTQASVSLYAQWLQCEFSGVTQSFNSPVATVVWHNQVRLPWQLTALSDLSASTNGHRGTVWQESSAQFDLGLNKSLGRWAFQLRVIDLLHTARQNTTSYGNDVTYTRHCYADRQRISLSLRYQFGSQKLQRTYQGVNAGAAERERMK